MHTTGEAGEVKGFLTGGITPANHDERFIPEHGQGSIAGGAVGDAFVFEEVFTFYPKVAVARSRGDNEGFCMDDLAINGDRERSLAEVYGFHPAEAAQPGPEAFRLLLHVHHELETIDPIDKAGVIFDNGGGSEQAARHDAGDHQRGQIRTGGVERRSEPSAAAADDDDVFHGLVDWERGAGKGSE